MPIQNISDSLYIADCCKVQVWSSLKVGDSAGGWRVNGPFSDQHKADLAGSLTLTSNLSDWCFLQFMGNNDIEYDRSLITEATYIILLPTA